MSAAFRHARNNKGVTLIELILTITLVLVAVVLMYSFFTFMLRSNSLTKQQSEIQENVILSKTFIDEKIRNAIALAISNTGEDPPLANWSESIYRDAVDGRGVIYIESEGEVIPLLAGLAEGFSMDLTFTKTENMFIRVSVGCITEDGYEYSIDTEIYLLGLEAYQSVGESGDRIFIVTD